MQCPGNCAYKMYTEDGIIMEEKEWSNNFEQECSKL